MHENYSYSDIGNGYNTVAWLELETCHVKLHVYQCVKSISSRAVSLRLCSQRSGARSQFS